MSAAAVELVGRLLRELATAQHPYLLWDGDWATVVALTDAWFDERGRPLLVRLGDEGRADVSSAVAGIAEGAEGIAWIEPAETPVNHDLATRKILCVIAFDSAEAHAWCCALDCDEASMVTVGMWHPADWMLPLRETVIAAARSVMAPQAPLRGKYSPCKRAKHETKDARRSGSILSPDEFEVSKSDLAREHAQQIVDAMNRNRHIIKRADAQVRRTDIAAEVGLSQSMISRILANRERYESSPIPIEEVVARFVLGHIDHDQMMQDLLARDFTDGTFPPGGHDAYVRGFWDELTLMHDLGLLNDQDFRRLTGDGC